MRSDYAYFLICLVLSASICILLFGLFLRRWGINRAKQNRSKYSFLLPSLIVLIFVFMALVDLRPRLLDLIEILEGNAYTYTFHSDNAVYGNNSLHIADEHFLRNPFSPTLKEGTYYRMRYAPHSRIVLELEELPDPEEAREK